MTNPSSLTSQERDEFIEVDELVSRSECRSAVGVGTTESTRQVLFRLRVFPTAGPYFYAVDLTHIQDMNMAIRRQNDCADIIIRKCDLLGVSHINASAWQMHGKGPERLRANGIFEGIDSHKIKFAVTKSKIKRQRIANLTV